MTTPQNYAAYLTEAEGDFVVKKAEYWTPGPGEVLIRNRAVALNPMDWKIQMLGKSIPFGITYPAIIGMDIAGEVCELGDNVTKFKHGDRVIAKSNWFLSHLPQDGGFQLYSVCEVAAMSLLPDSIPFTTGCVLPLAVSTGAMALYPSYRFGLPLPSPNPSKSTSTSSGTKILLVWGGSSSTGTAAIQMAVASGVRVIATASAKNHALVKSVGAEQVVDYTAADEQTVIADLAERMRRMRDDANGKPGQAEIVGALDAIAEEKTCRACIGVMQSLGGGKVVTYGPRLPDTMEAVPGVELIGVNNTGHLSQHKEIAHGIWGVYVPEGLRTGSLQPVPSPLVVGKGLDKVAEAIELGKKGVSAGKLVIEL